MNYEKKQVIFYTHAYNAEKTIARTIESVFAQTEQNWIWHLVDNAASDRTGEIIHKYAAMDTRIVPKRNTVNNVYEKGNNWRGAIAGHDNNDFICFLDADDEYKPDFLTHILRFISDNKLDIAACGYDFIDASNGQLNGMRNLERNLILEKPEAFAADFPIYHQFMRTTWGKLYKISILEQLDFTRLPFMPYGGDTLFAMEAFRNASRVGILAESLHKYYINPQSKSYKWDDRRIISDRILDDTARTFLITKCGSISPQNNQFLLEVYFHAIKDTLGVLMNAQIPDADKLAGLNDIFTSDNTKRIITWTGYPEEKKQLFKNVSNWLISQTECRKSENLETAVAILITINPNLLQFLKLDSLEYLLLNTPEIIGCILENDYSHILKRLQTWSKKHNKDNLHLTETEIAAYRALNKPDNGMYDLFIDIKMNRPQTAGELDIDAHIIKLLAKYPLLQNVSIGLAMQFTRIVALIIGDDLPLALDEFLRVSENAEIAEGDAESYFLLAQNLSAAADNMEIFIYFKKIWISYLLSCSRIEDAKAELDEFEQILPGDEDLAEFRQFILDNFSHL